MTPSRILVVDDEEGIRELLTDCLRAEGFEVDAARDATEALSLIRDNIYDAAIVDFNLPDMDGVMLHRQVRQMDPELGQKTLFMSGLLQPEGNLDYYSAHGGGFLAKPFNPRDVADAVRSLLSGR